MSWSAKQFDDRQTAMFDVLMGEVVPSMKRCDTSADARAQNCSAPSCPHLAASDSRYCDWHRANPQDR